VACYNLFDQLPSASSHYCTASTIGAESYWTRRMLVTSLFKEPQNMTLGDLSFV